MVHSPKATPVQPDLAAVLIVRNEARCIVRCLESVAPWVDRMVVLDTGSTDDTAALAARCGAQVHHLPWPDDFSAARNHALAIADADWNLILDADEWIAAGGETLRKWCTGPKRLGAVCVDSSFDSPEGAGGAAALSSRSWITRILPRGARYQGRIHEQVISPLPRERMAVEIGHDGYRDAQTATKADRNRPLLLRDLRDHPGDPYILFQLGKDAEVRRDYGDAAEYYGEAFAATAPDANWRHELIVRYLHCLGQGGYGEEALILADEQMADWMGSPDFFFVLGNLLLDRAIVDPAQAVDQWLPFAATAWERCLEIGERPDLEGSVHGRGTHLAQHNLDVVRSQIALLEG